MARVGAARIFFDVVGSFQAQKFMAETKSGMMAFKNITESIMIDTMTAVTDSVRIFGDAFQQVLDNTVPLATNVSLARIEFEKFARGITGVRMEEMQTQLRGIGEEFAFTAEQSFQAGARMSQLSGILKSQEAVLAATKGSLQFGFVGGMTSETAAQRMIQLQAQTNFMFGETTEAQFDLMSAQQQADLVTQNLNKTITSLNTIENRSAATMEDLTFVMNQFASAATLAGDSIEQMAAFSAVLIEAGEQQGKAGRALRMIYARLGSNIKNNNAVLEQYIGSVKDTTGTVLPLSDILGRLAEHWPTLSGAVKQNIAQTVAGNDHYIRFIKLMDNYERSVTLATQAQQGLDDVTEEMALFQEDPSFQLKILQAELENVREEMGQKLTPIVIGQTKAQIAMTQANTDLITSFLALGDALGIDEEGIAIFMELSSMFANMANTAVERFINIKNMNVALTTQHLILQAISGEEFVRAKGSDQIAAAGHTQVSLLEKQLTLKNQLSLLNLEASFEQRQINQLKDTQIRAERIIKDNNIKIMDNMRAMNINKIEGLNLRQKEVSNADLLNIKILEMLRMEKEITSLAKERSNILQAEAKFRGMAKTDVSLEALKQQARLLHEAGQVELQTSSAQLGPLLRLEAMKKLGIELTQRQQSRMENLQETVGKTGASYFQLADDIVKYIQVTMEARGQTDGLAFSQEELELAIRTVVLAKEELGTVSQQLGIHESALKDIMKEVEMGTIDLEEAMVALGQAKQNAIRNPIDMEAEKQELMEMQERIEQVNLRLNSMALGAGLASFAVKGLGRVVGLDKRESTAAAMMAMHSSMIFTTTQMVTMQVQMMVTTGAAKNMSAALRSVAIASGGTLLAVAAVSLVIGKLVGNSQAAAQAEIEHRNAVVATNQALAARVAGEGFSDLFEEESRSNAQIQDRLSLIDEEIASINALGDAQTLLTEEKKQAFKDEKDELTAILRTRQATALESMNITEGMLKSTQEVLDLGGIDGLAAEIARLEEGLMFEGLLGGSDIRRQRGEPINAVESLLFRLLDIQELFAHMTEDELSNFVGFMTALNDSFDTGIDTIPEFADALDMFAISADEAGTAIDDNITGTIDEAQQSLEGFNSALEEFFFGGQISLATGDLLKQVVNKGAENLIQNTELIMTNNFFGLTLPEMVDTISEAVTDQLMQRGIVQTSGMSV